MERPDDEETDMRKSIEWKTAVAALGLAIAGCGGGGGQEAETARFLGTWNATSGTETVTCPGQNESLPVTGTVRWDKGLSSDLVQATPPCIVNVDVAGSTAAGAGPTCSYDDGVGGTVMLTTPTYTFVLAPDGRTAQENSSGTLLGTNAGVTVSCTFSETASYTKIGN
jgi:hypothetical protein